METKPKPPLGKLVLLHQTQEEVTKRIPLNGGRKVVFDDDDGLASGVRVNDNSPCIYCGKPLKDWQSMEPCPERSKGQKAN